MNESLFWNLIRRNVKGHFERVENVISPGTPDVNYCFTVDGRKYEGWIELKWIKEFPKRASTVVKIPHFTDDQRNWIIQRIGNGGSVWVFLRVEREFFLFDGFTASRHVGIDLVRKGLRDEAYGYWSPRVDWDEFMKELSVDSMTMTT